MIVQPIVTHTFGTGREHTARLIGRMLAEVAPALAIINDERADTLEDRVTVVTDFTERPHIVMEEANRAAKTSSAEDV